MKTKVFVIYCIFVVGAALMYGTQDVCNQYASGIDGAKVERVNSFLDMVR